MAHLPPETVVSPLARNAKVAPALFVELEALDRITARWMRNIPATHCRNDKIARSALSRVPLRCAVGAADMNNLATARVGKSARCRYCRHIVVVVVFHLLSSVTVEIRPLLSGSALRLDQSSVEIGESRLLVALGRHVVLDRTAMLDGRVATAVAHLIVVGRHVVLQQFFFVVLVRFVDYNVGAIDFSGNLASNNVIGFDAVRAALFPRRAADRGGGGGASRRAIVVTGALRGVATPVAGI